MVKSERQTHWHQPAHGVPRVDTPVVNARCAPCWLPNLGSAHHGEGLDLQLAVKQRSVLERHAMVRNKDILPEILAWGILL